MIKENNAVIMSYSITFLFFLILSVWLTQPSFADDIIGSVHEEICTINHINGEVVKTSCRLFSLGEEVKITDISGRLIQIYEIPLPCEAKLVYQCISKKNCASIKSIKILKKIKEIPK